MADVSEIFGSANNFSICLYWSSRSMRKTEKKIRKEKNTSLAAPGALAHRLQRRTTCNTAPPATPHRVPVGPKMADGVWKGVYP